ncbi:cytidyltransferase-related domain [Magnetococcus marinus MC-1]|uniref:Cytidyltransferase-related domain n=1 Tax=Magnetococcus marinus (strain ATCC BAA-1437 / JCM 17883 / MC-1) TaxID=156889 RepID=A0L6I7_MAGMM|nr:PfkB family carbohydrate kinase [Magnetococcus marinus]ABK43580.1 cytidyltransferase-related domain [Magnetococcus marinus MC-1]
MAPSLKVLTLDQLAAQCQTLRMQGQRIVQCHGTFDLLHPGHMRHLQRAREQGDVLVVTLTADGFVNKGPNRPVFPEHLRAESLASLTYVDYVAVNYDLTAVPAITKVRPNVYVKGQDYKQAKDDITGNIALERHAVEVHGGEIFFTEEIVFSSSSLINDYLDVFPPATKDFLDQFKKRWPPQRVIDAVRTFADMKVLVVGEAIIDEYCYTTPMGTIGKGGNIIATRYNDKEIFAGGSLAIANHLSGFVKEVALLTGIGPNCPHEPFMRQQLQENVHPHFFHYEEAPTLVKRRYVDETAKLFEIYYYDPSPLTEEVDQGLCAWIRQHAPDYDLVVVPDYGNGFISPAMVDALCDAAPYLAVNTQINSGNRGYHVISRYRRADFVSLNEPEVRLAAHNRRDPLETVALQIGHQVHAKQMSITMGTNGAMMLDIEQDQAMRIPALATQVVDIIGAGDAFLTLAALAARAGLATELGAFLGSTAAALDLQIVCNRSFVTPEALLKFATSLLK